MGFHSVESYDRILGEGQDDAGRIPGSFDTSKYGKTTNTSTSTTKPVEENLTKSTDSQVVSGMYDMRLGEKTDIRTGRAVSAGATEEPLESYIPGVGRKNRSPNAEVIGEHSSHEKSHQPLEPEHYGTQIPHSHEKEEPLESYIPGVGRRNHPFDPEMAKMGKMGHTTGAREAKIGETSSGNTTMDPHIPGTGRITEPSHHMKKSNFNPSQMPAVKMDSQHMGHQSTSIPGFESMGRNRAPAAETSKQLYDPQNDTIDRGDVPRPAHVNECPRSSISARRDSRNVSQFNEPNDLEPRARQGSNKHDEPASSFPAHAYSTPKTDLGANEPPTSQVRGPNVATAEPAGYKTKDHPATSGSGNSDKSYHEQESGRSASHTDHSRPTLFGRELGFNKSHHEQNQEASHEHNSSHSGPKLFGKELNFGKTHHEHEHEPDANIPSNPISPRALSGTTERSRTGSTISTGDRRSSTGSTGDKSKIYPSKRATVEDQPVKEKPMEAGAKKTERSLSIGSEEAGSYAKNVGNMPSLVDPSVPTYRYEGATTATFGEGGAYKVHSEGMAERKVSVGSHEHTSHSPEFETHKSGVSSGAHAHSGEGHVHRDPIFEESLRPQEAYGPESVPRSHSQKDMSDQHKEESKEGHPKAGVFDTIKKAISHHNE